LLTALNPARDPQPFPVPSRGLDMTTLERLSRILVQRYELDPAQLTPDLPLSSLGIDSLGMVEILFFIEDEFGVQFPSDDLTFATLAEAAKYVDGLIAKRKAPSPAV
jgi:acyl carrier protein